LGRGVRQDMVEAERWFRKAADKGLAAARDNLHQLREQGRSDMSQSQPIDETNPR